MVTIEDFKNYFWSISKAEDFGIEQLIARITDLVKEFGMITLVNYSDCYNINKDIYFSIKQLEFHYDTANSDVTKHKVMLDAVDFDNYEHPIELSELDSDQLLSIYDSLLKLLY